MLVKDFISMISYVEEGTEINLVPFFPVNGNENVVIIPFTEWSDYVNEWLVLEDLTIDSIELSDRNIGIIFDYPNGSEETVWLLLDNLGVE